MHLLNTYALNCGLKIDKPYIYTMFYPLGESDYITIQPFSNYSGKQYDYWNEVINYMFPKLSDKGIKIVQIGNKEDPPIAHCVWTQGTTSISQASFLIKNSKLHLGVDSFGVHIASGYNRKIVALYSTNWAENCKPYWSNPKDFVLLEPDRSKRKPSFQYEDEPPKTINEIKPEVIADSALRLLNLNYKINHETIYIGDSYSRYNLHVVPTPDRLELEGVQHLIVRMDLEFNEDVLWDIIGSTDSVSIVTNKTVDKEIIEKFKHKIKEVVYTLGEDDDIEFVKYLHGLGMNHVLLTSMEGQKLKDLKYKYLDYNFIFSKNKNDKERDSILGDNDLSSLAFKTNRKIIKDKLVYPSIASLNAGKPLEDLTSHELSPVIDAPEFWEDVEYFYIAKKLD